MDELNLRHLRCVVVLAEELNFGRAAERLHISQPPLTRLLMEVEDAVGVKLFDRTTRRVALTPIGEIFVAEARSVLARMDEAVRQIENAVRKHSVQIRVVYTPLAFLTVLPDILLQYRGRHSEVKIDLLEMNTDSQRRALLSERADFAFPDEPFRTEDFQCLRLHRELLSVVLPEDHPQAQHSRVSLKDLRGETFLLRPRAEYPEYYDRFFAACAALGFSPKVRYPEVGQDVLNLVLSGSGITFTPKNCIPADEPDLHFATLDSPLPLYADVWAAWLRRMESPQVQTLVELVRKREN